VSAVFTIAVPIRFAHCDPAGIVFFPRYLEFANQVVEDWFAGPLDMPFDRLHGPEGRSVPTVRLETDFLKPTRLGETLEIALRVERLGRTSCALATEMSAGGAVRVRVRQVIVHADGATLKPLRWPDDLRARMTPFLTPEAD